jgi:hypothetical protein
MIDEARSPLDEESSADHKSAQDRPISSQFETQGSTANICRPIAYVTRTDRFI